MTILVVPAPPPREVEYELTHKGMLLTLTVQRVTGVSKKTGEVRYRSHKTVYIVVREPGLVRLLREDGTAVVVTERGCSCEDAAFVGRRRECKHRTSVKALGLLGANIATSTSGA